MKKGIANPADFRQEIKECFFRQSVEITETLADSELEDLQMQLYSKFTSEERKKLAKMAEKLNKYIKKLNSRPFLQVMAGSATKASLRNESARSFNVYEIDYDKMGFRFSIIQYDWEDNKFKNSNTRINFNFLDSRKLVLEDAEG